MFSKPLSRKWTISFSFSLVGADKSQSNQWYAPRKRGEFMSDWIAKAVEDKRSEKAEYDKAIGTAQFEREKILAASSEVFSLLMETVKQDVAEFNRLFTDHEKQLKPLEMIGEEGFKVERQYHPNYLLTVQFYSTVPTIKYVVKWPDDSNPNIQASTVGTFGFGLDNSVKNTLLLDRGQAITVEKASEKLLRPAVVL
jgi:hypothetical protein